LVGSILDWFVGGVIEHDFFYNSLLQSITVKPCRCPAFT